MRRVNPELLKMAAEKVAVVPPGADPAAAGGAPPGGAMPPGAGGAPPMDPAAAGGMPPGMPPGAAPPPGMPPMDPSMMGQMPPQGGNQGGSSGKPKLDPVHIEKRLYDLEKKLARIMGASGIEIPAEDTVAPPAQELEQQMQQSMMSDQSPVDQQPPPAAAPPGGGLGQVGGMEAMAGPKMAQHRPQHIGRAVPHAGTTRTKAAGLAEVLRRRNARYAQDRSA